MDQAVTDDSALLLARFSLAKDSRIKSCILSFEALPLIKFLRISLAVLAIAAVSACSDVGSPVSSKRGSSVDLVGDRNDVYSVIPGVVNVCVFHGEIVATSSFVASAPAGEDVLGGVFSITPSPHCIEVWNASSTSTVEVSATLSAAAAGYAIDRIYWAYGDGTTETSGWVYDATSASVPVSDLVGGAIWFKMKVAPIVEPPEPPQGGQGCTPGYWRQEHHYDSWTAPYTPTTQFSDVFANAFPGKTLGEVVRLGGGGLNALGRMAVASLLNAASANVSFDLTTAQVISQFNAAYASGRKGTIEDVKNVLDMLNNQGCPLN